MKPADEQDMAIGAVRCYRAARERGERDVMPHLHALLDRYGCGLLTPAFMGLICTYETCLGRTLCAGYGKALSIDEYGLLALLGNPARCQTVLRRAEIGPDLRAILVSAAASTRLMLHLEHMAGMGTAVPAREPTHG